MHESSLSPVWAVQPIMITNKPTLANTWAAIGTSLLLISTTISQSPTSIPRLQQGFSYYHSSQNSLSKAQPSWILNSGCFGGAEGGYYCYGGLRQPRYVGYLVKAHFSWRLHALDSPISMKDILLWLLGVGVVVLRMVLVHTVSEVRC